MKKVIITTLCFISLSPLSQAQHRSPRRLSKTNTEQKHHNIKLNMFSLFWGQPGLNYEYVISPSFSIQASGSYLIRRKLISYLNYIPEDYTGYTLNKNHYQGFVTSLEGRYFTGKEAPKGFYIGPFGRYYNYWANVEMAFTNPDNNYSVSTKIGLQNLSVGVQTGWQFLIKDMISVDFSFAGLGVSFVNVYGNFHSSEIDSKLLEDMKSKVKDLGIIGDDLEFENKEHGYEIDYSYKTLAWRSSIRIGFYF